MPDENPYPFGEFGERAGSVGGPIPPSEVSKGLIKVDAVRWAQEKIIVDPDNPRPGPAAIYKSEVQDDEDAYRIIAVDLDNPAQMWDLARFRNESRNTSWYAEVGHMPTRLLIWIDNAQDSIHIWDRADMTEWMVFDGNASDMLVSSGSNLNGLAFLDGRLYVASGGGIALGVVDFVKDKGYNYSTSGLQTYKTDISGRNDGDGFLALNASPAIVSNTVNAVAAIRDPDGGEDEFGRPKHIVAVGTAGGISVSDAGIDNIYDSSNTTDILHLEGTSEGIVAATSDGVRDNLYTKWDIRTISADAWITDGRWANSNAGYEDLPWNNAAVVSKCAVIEGASIAEAETDLLVLGSDEGLAIGHEGRSGSRADGLMFIVNTKNHPPYSSTVVDVWSLDDATGLFGKTLTANDVGVTYGTGVIGNCATFVSDDYLERLGDADFNLGTGDWCWAFWIQIPTLGGVNRNLMQADDGGVADYVKVQYRGDSSGKLELQISDDNGASSDSIMTAATGLDDGAWHHVVVGRSGSNWVIRLDGEPSNTGAVTSAAASIDPDDFWMGAKGSANGLKLDQFAWIKGRYLSDSECRFLHRRGLSAIQSSVNTSDALDAADVVYVAVDPNGEYILAGNETNFVIFNRFGIPILEDASPGGNIQDAAVWSSPGSTGPSYAIGAASAVEVVQEAVILADA